MQSVRVYRIFGVCFMLALARLALADAPATVPVVTTPETAASTASNVPMLFNLGVGISRFWVDGNVKRAEQYVTPSGGVLQLHYLGSNGLSLYDLNLNEGTHGAANSLYLYSGANGVEVQGQQRASEFYQDWTATGEPLTRRDQTLDVNAPVRGGELQVSDQLNTLSSQSTSNPEDWTREVTSVGLAEHAGGWLTRFGVANDHFEFNTGGPQYSGAQQSATFSLASPASDRTSIEGNAAISRLALSTDEFNTTPSTVQLSLAGTQLIGSALSLNGQVTHNELNDSITLNSYAKRDTGANLEVDFMGIPRMNVAVGGGTDLVGYVNTPQITLFDTSENDVFAKVTSRLTKQLSLRAGVTDWWTNNRPAAFDILTSEETGSLVWSSKQDAQVELSYNPTWNTGLVAGWHGLGWTNQDFAASNTINTGSLFGWWMPRDAVTLYASYLTQRYNLHATADSDAYVTDARHDLVFGLSWQATPRLCWDGSYTIGGGTGAEGTGQHTTTLGATYRWPTGTALSVRAVLDGFEADNLPTLGYESSWYEVQLSKAIF